MRIGITLNDVVRAYTEQLSYVHSKYKLFGLEEKIEDKDKLSEEELETELEKIQGIRDSYDVTINPLKDFELDTYFDFESRSDLNEFQYREASLEIFGHADELHKNLVSRLNEFAMDIEDEEEHELQLISRDVYNAIPATCFFLSKTACKLKNIRFVNEPEEKWDGIDVLITANPIALKNKPDGKISIKIKTSYNGDIDSDYEFDTIIDFIKDETKRDEILNSIKA
ncbi:MAG: hypothetical protein ACW98D_17175 [Promethearchaeota archaeon]|jgi:hypothetical protein